MTSCFEGGAIGVGNRGPVSEFNILCDPEAASIVFQCGLPVVMVPLEVTHTALATPMVLSDIATKCANSRFSTCMVELLTFFKDTYLRVFKFESPPVHDPCAGAASLSLLMPSPSNTYKHALLPRDLFGFFIENKLVLFLLWLCFPANTVAFFFDELQCDEQSHGCLTRANSKQS